MPAIAPDPPDRPTCPSSLPNFPRVSDWKR